MDNITHSLFGATLARTPLGRAGRGTTAALILASNAPDIDIVATAGGTLKYLEWHRGDPRASRDRRIGSRDAALVYGARRLIDRGRTSSAVNVHNKAVVQLADLHPGRALSHLMDLRRRMARIFSAHSIGKYAFDWMPISKHLFTGCTRRRPADRPAMAGVAPGAVSC
jgi:hypothetical protein